MVTLLLAVVYGGIAVLGGIIARSLGLPEIWSYFLSGVFTYLFTILLGTLVND